MSALTTCGELRRFEAKYTLSETQLGDGGYGVVCKGLDKNTREPVAVKVILKDNYAKADLPRLAVEIALCKRLSHKHLVQCRDVFDIESRRQVRIVMQLARGEELFDLIQQKGVIEEAVTKVIIYQLMLALQYLHSQQIIFRDVKPENILLSEPFISGKHHILLCDFGLAVVKGEERARGAFGSVYYIAPEALVSLPPNEDYNEKVDVWAAGIVAHACVAGYPPFCTANNRNDEILKLIENTDLDVNVPELSSASTDFINFLQETIRRDVSTRLSATEALGHPWLKNLSDEKNSAVKHNFSNYKNYSKSK
ncbi:myosin light chain kinase A-like [Symsagittifera roscoffensis]|uniref:myosin light chain kinase A-like n=1 Tax=Symsagittifera roscoffensis TaxID=84072 RepID=UPI00307C26F3